ncbi:MAG: PepSY domain-containing protein [Dermatophilus congolensis]|nr:PepSY domain-containing protein [Dermatophilus congolensis]
MRTGTTRNTTAMRGFAGIGAASALVLALGACAGNDGSAPRPADGGAVSVTSPATSPTSAAETTATTAGALTAAPADAQARNAAALAAIATAEKAAGGTAYEIDDENDDQTWEVDVMVGDRSVEVQVSGDGATAQGQTDDDDADDDDKARLGRAKTTLAQGIEAALTEVPGALDDVDLDDKDDVDAWKVTIDESDNDDVEVYVATDDLRILAVER